MASLWGNHQTSAVYGCASVYTAECLSESNGVTLCFNFTVMPDFTLASTSYSTHILKAKVVKPIFIGYLRLYNKQCQIYQQITWYELAGVF